MAITFSLAVGTENLDTTISPDETLSTINLRASPYSSATYNGTHIDHGIYQFSSVASGEYKVYSGGSELSIFGIIKIGEDGAILTTGAQTKAGVLTLSDAPVMTSGLNTNTISERSAGNGIYIDSVHLKDNIVTASDAQLTTATIGTLELTQLGADFSAAGWEINGLVAPTVNSAAANKEYVDDAVAGISVTPYQESVNVVRLMIGGTQQTNQVYTTYISALAWALAQPPSSTWIITIDIEGMGNAGATSITMGTSSGVYIDDYINLNGKNHSIVLIPPDDTVGVSTLGTSKISNLTIYKNDAGSDPIFTNIEFNNVLFDLTVNTVTFNTCKFYNCVFKINSDGDATATYTTCVGANNISNQSFGSSAMRGTDLVPKADI